MNPAFDKVYAPPRFREVLPLYVLGGVWLIQNWGSDSVLWRGHGWGVVIQGGFLFFFDFLHAFALRKLRTK